MSCNNSTLPEIDYPYEDLFWYEARGLLKDNPGYNIRWTGIYKDSISYGQKQGVFFTLLHCGDILKSLDFKIIKGKIEIPIQTVHICEHGFMIYKDYKPKDKINIPFSRGMSVFLECDLRFMLNCYITVFYESLFIQKSEWQNFNKPEQKGIDLIYDSFEIPRDVFEISERWLVVSENEKRLAILKRAFKKYLFRIKLERRITLKKYLIKDICRIILKN